MKKFKEFFENLWYYLCVPYRKFKTFRYWLRLRWNKKYLHLVKCVLTDYPWDHAFLLRLEKAKIEDMLYYHENHQLICDEDRNRILTTLRLASSLLSIITEERDLFHYDGEIKFKKKEGTDLYQMDSSELKYYCDVNVNMRNIHRFTDGKEFKKKLFELHKHDLYIEKAKRLYAIVRYRYTGYWWD